jgi:hypothetical protein
MDAEIELQRAATKAMEHDKARKMAVAEGEKARLDADEARQREQRAVALRDDLESRLAEARTKVRVA